MSRFRIALVFVFLCPFPAFALICSAPDPEEYISNAGLIFRGTVISVERAPLKGAATIGIGGLGPLMLARFRVQSVLKGRVDQEITLQYREDRGGRCGCSFSTGQTTIVLADRSRTAGDHANGCTFPISDQSIPSEKDRYLAALEHYVNTRAMLTGLRHREHSNKRVLREQADFYIKYRDFDEADEALSRLIDLTPHDMAAMVDRGRARYLAFRFESALQDYRAALLIDSNHKVAIRGQAHALVRIKRQREIQNGQWDLSGFATENGQKLDLTGLNLRGANFTNAELDQVDFTGSDLTDADFSNARISNSNFSRAILTGTKFDSARQLHGLNFGFARIDRAQFVRSNLSQVNFGGATLSDVGIVNSTLWDVTFHGSHFANVNLTGTCFHVKHSKTVWPDGYNPTAAGATVCKSDTGPVDALKGLKGLFGK